MQKGVFNVVYVCSTCNDVSKTLQRVTERIDSGKVRKEFQEIR